MTGWDSLRHEQHKPSALICTPKVLPAIFKSVYTCKSAYTGRTSLARYRLRSGKCLILSVVEADRGDQER